MANVLIMGESGAGKTTAMRNLDPATTFYIDADGKGLSWRGWREQFNAEAKNYFRSDDPAKIEDLIVKINTKPELAYIKVIVIDTLSGVMVADEVRRMAEKGYDKWVDLAQCVWHLVELANHVRPDLDIVILAHSQTQKEDDGYTFTRVKTSGKKLDKLCLESKFTTVLYAVAKNGKYVFETRANNSTAKTPLGAFKDAEIDNDIVPVLATLKEY